MALIGNNADTLLNGLSAFWHRFFRDIKDIQATYEGTEILLGQIYLNLMSDVLNTSVVEAPLFRKEFYKLITVREDQLVFKEQGDTIATPTVPSFYGNPGTDRYVLQSDTFYGAIPQLQDTIFAPKASLENGTDYKIAGGEIHFKIDPTNPVLPGFAQRRVVIATGGKFTSTGLPSWIGAGVEKGDTLYFSESINLGTTSLLNAQDDARKATVIHVTDKYLTVSLDTPMPTFPVGAVPTGFSWRVMRVKDDGTYNTTLPRYDDILLTPTAPFTDGKIDYTSTLEVSELSFWAVDAKVDDLTLYNTYGYFFTNSQLSTESYRSLIRGLMQLYILGPAMARLESALNLTAGLATIREEGEILELYDSGVLATGLSGELLAGSIFQVPAPLFSSISVGGYIQITASDFANNIGSFNIIQYISSTQVKLQAVVPFTPNTGLEWLYTKTNKQIVTTDRNTYEYPLNTPIRADIKDTNNFNVLSFRAFESLTTAIRVTDYVQDPEWWHEITIPIELLPGLTAPQRTSTPQLYPNVLGPAGNASIGDPGFYLGRDEDSGNLQQGATGKLLAGNIFETPYNTFSLQSLDGYVQIYGPTVNGVNTGIFQIATYISPTQVTLTPLTFFTPEEDLSWGYFTGHIATVPYRHNAAFILLDRFLKLHMFAVLVDQSVQLTGLLVTDLQKILRDVKPVHTALYFRPLTSFTDVVDLTDALTLHLVLRKIEEVGIVNNEFAIGSSWLIGNTWRFLNPTGGALDINPGSGGMFAAIGGADPSIQPASVPDTPPGSAPDLRWIDRPLYVYMHV